MKKILLVQMIVSIFFGLNARAAFPLNASDIVEYSLTATGIKYLLRNKRGTLNKWKFGAEEISSFAESDTASGYKPIDIREYGNTDCSGLVSAALRVKDKYYAPNSIKRATYGTTIIYDVASDKEDDELSHIPWENEKGELNIRRGDAFNKRRTNGVTSYGHTGILNGKTPHGARSTVEARGGRRSGVGPFTMTLNDLRLKRKKEIYGFRIVRRSGVSYSELSADKIIPLRNARAICSTHSDNSCNEGRGQRVARGRNNHYHYVKKNETGYSIARLYPGVSFSDLERLNPDVQWNRLRINQKIIIKSSRGISRRAEHIVHKVVKDETLWAMSRKFKVSVKDIIDYHYSVTEVKISPYEIREGMMIYIPQDV